MILGDSNDDDGGGSFLTASMEPLDKNNVGDDHYHKVCVHRCRIIACKSRKIF